MTFKEKWLQDHPDKTDRIGAVIAGSCPDRFNYEPSRSDCPRDSKCDSRFMTCPDCWNREIPETENKKESKNMRKTKDELLQEIADLRKELEAATRMDKYKDAAGDLKAGMDALIEGGFTREEAMSIILAAAKM